MSSEMEKRIVVPPLPIIPVSLKQLIFPSSEGAVGQIQVLLPDTLAPIASDVQRGLGWMR